ncbi:PepSY-associated TM helix domain-containing protein [Colwelliaceae bacterium 6441]
MSRKLLVKIHLYLATFLAPIIIMIALSGGLYLFGYKGETIKTPVYSGSASEINLQAKDIKTEVNRIFKQVGIEHEFEYIKGNSQVAYTRPTSRDYYVLSIDGDRFNIIKEQPDFIKTIVELHKGHGPQSFKTLQKITAFGLIFILVSGLWLAFSTPSMRKISLIITAAGATTFLILC